MKAGKFLKCSASVSRTASAWERDLYEQILYDCEVMSARLAIWRDWVLQKEERQIRSKLFSVQHLKASSNTSSSSCLNIFMPLERYTDKWTWKNSEVFIRLGFEVWTSALYFIADPSTRPSKKPQFPLKCLLRIVVIKYLGFIGFLSCRRLPWGKFSKGMEELTADCDRLRGNKVQNEFKPGGLWGEVTCLFFLHTAV